jgi:uncharacterized OB-fold protein
VSDAADSEGTTLESVLVPGLFTVGGDGAPSLLGSRCESCGEVAFPARKVCPRCKRFSTVPANIGQRATLFSFTVCHAAPAGWEAPYLQAYVELPEGIRVFTLVSASVEPSTGALQTGMPMQLEVEPVHGKTGPLTYKYAPLQAA